MSSITEKHGLENASSNEEPIKKIRLCNENPQNFKLVFVTVGVIGVGKSTICATLAELFDWKHIQSDNVKDGSNAFEKAVVKCISKNSSCEVFIADRNNHMKRERANLLKFLKGESDEDNSKESAKNVKVIALNFLPEGVDKFKDSNEASIKQITTARVLNREHHQCINKDEPEKVDKIMQGFIDRFENVDTSCTPDLRFDSIINLTNALQNGTQNSVSIIKQILEFVNSFENFPQREKIESITDQQILKALEDIMKKVPTKLKIFHENGMITVHPRIPKFEKPVNEKDVGISKFIVDAEGQGFRGTLKQRYIDFLVNEIDLDNQVVHLLDTGVERPKKESKPVKEEGNQQEVLKDEEQIGSNCLKNEESSDKPKEEVLEKTEKFPITDAERLKLISILGTEQQYNEFNESVLKNSAIFTTEKKFGDKSERTEIHQFLRNVFQNKLESITNPDSSIKICVSNRDTRRPKNKAKNEKQKQDDLLFGKKKEFLHFVMYKQNKDTMEAANLIAKFTRLNPKTIRYAGTKDRRGITVQRMCVSRTDAYRLNNLNKSLRGVKLGEFKYKDVGLNLGELKGNEFVITIRDVQFDKHETTEGVTNFEELGKIIEKNFKALKQNGFINYYGMQRFGTFSISTHEIGKQILLGDYETACELILSNQEHVLPDLIEAREIWETTRNPQLTIKKMPKKCMAESCILKGLNEDYLNATNNKKRGHHGNLGGAQFNYFQALMKIPRNLRLMYGHAYQSYVWNCVVSRRFEQFGMNVVEGDLVIVDESTKIEEEEDVDDILDGGEDLRKDTFVRARPVTAKEIEQKRFNIFDVVLPSPGFDVVYPENAEIRQVYVDVMSKDGLSPFKMARNVRDFSFAGSYRNIVAKPEGLLYDIRRYEDSIEKLVNDDLEILEEYRKERGGDLTGYKFDESKRVAEQKKEGGNRTGIVLKMRLGTSSYATMALRELMKIDTTRRSESFDVKVDDASK